MKFWAEDELSRAISLWRGGKTAKEIGDILGRNRSQVIGALNRAGERANAKVFKRKSRPIAFAPIGQRHLRETAGFAACFSTAATDAVLRLGPHDCKWPIGDPKAADFAFCGAPRDGEHPYCHHHRKQEKDRVKAATRRPADD